MLALFVQFAGNCTDDHGTGKTTESQELTKTDITQSAYMYSAGFYRLRGGKIAICVDRARGG